MKFDDSNETSHPKTVLVMGGSGVIGSAICLRFAEANWKVGIHYHQHEETARAVYSHLFDQEETHSLFQADVRDPQQIHHVIERFSKHWKRLDALIWSVGQTENLLTVRTSPDQWDRLIQTNLSGLFFCLRAVGPAFHAQQTGSVMVVSSLASHKGATGQAAYTATKAGVLGLVRSVAQEWGESQIRVNAVFPGWHPSALSDAAFSRTDFSQDHLLGHPPSLKDTADHIFHLATARDISGQFYNLDSRIW